MVYHLELKKYIDGLDFLAKTKKNFFGGILPQNILSEKSGLVSFLPLRHPNFVRNIRQIVWAILEKTWLLTDLLSYWKWWFHRTHIRLKVGTQQRGGCHSGATKNDIIFAKKLREMKKKKKCSWSNNINILEYIPD